MDRESLVRGCLLGLAVGDAMGHPIDKKNWDEITESYGPNGLLGYDLMDGGADVTSYTQFAAYTCNAMILGACRGHQDRYIQYIARGLREWSKGQQYRGVAEKTLCWIAQVPQLRRRLCMDTRITDALRRETLGTPEKPITYNDGPGMLTIAVAIGLMFDSAKQTPRQLRRLAMEAVALVTGDRLAFLSGAFIATAIASILQEPSVALSRHYGAACDALLEQFGEDLPETKILVDRIQYAMELTRDPELTPLAAITLLDCRTAVQCLAGSVYASMIHPANFDEGMIAAVNHSGFSAATGALTGAFLGAKLGAEALPEFYLESLDAAPTLEELARDLVIGRQTMLIFDDHWDEKYVQGMPSQA